MSIQKNKKLKIINSEEFIRYIIEQHCSLSRFGDGKLDSIEGLGGDHQHPSKRLSSILLECLLADSPHHKTFISNWLKNYDGRPT